MKKILILQLIIFPFIGFGQEWAPTGAKWYYDHHDGTPPYLTYIESVGDTIINDSDCKILETYRISENTNDGLVYSWDTLKISRDFLYYSQDTIFHYSDNDFYPLYLFNVKQFDTIMVKEAEECVEFDYSCSKFEYVVDSIGNTKIDGQNLKLIYNSLTDDSDWTFNLSWNLEERPIIEMIGSSKYFFGLHRNSVLEGDIACLRCYIDNNISYKAEYWDKDCNYLRPLQGQTSINDENSENQLEIYPNPFRSTLNISGNLEIQYQILNCEGRVLMEGDDNILNTEGLPEGLYFLKVIDNNKIKIVTLIKHLP